MNKKLLALLGIVAITGMSAMAQAAAPSVDSIVTGAETTFTAVATLCVAIGVFFVGYKLAKRVK